MEYSYDKIVANSLDEEDKQHLKITLQRYSNRLQTYKDIVNKAPPKRFFEENTNKVIEDKSFKSLGKPITSLIDISSRLRSILQASTSLGPSTGCSR